MFAFALNMTVKILQSIYKEVALVFLSLIVLSLYPLFVSLLLPLVIYRYIVMQIAKRDPKLGNIISGADAQFAAHNTYLKPSSVLVPFTTLSTKVDRTNVIKVFTQQILKPKENGGQCWFPELTQRIVRRYGYNFWHKVENFNLENHINYLDPMNPDQLVCRSQLTHIIEKDLSDRPFDPLTSPWEMLLVPNFYDEKDPEVKSIVLVRFHHCLVDGFSIINFWQKLSVTPWKTLSGNAKTFRLSRIQRLIQLLRIIFTGPYLFLKMLHFTQDFNEWATKLQNEATGSFVAQEVSAPLGVVKNVKNLFSVNFSSVVIAMMTEAVVRTMKTLSSEPPAAFHITMPWPLPGHPDGLTNHWGVVRFPVTIYKDDPVKTLKRIDKEYNAFRSSIIPYLSFYLLKVIGCLPVAMIPEPNDLLRSTCLLSNFPGPLQKVDMLGYEIRNSSFGGKPPKGHGIAASVMSYNGKVLFGAGGDSCILTTQKDADFLATSFLNAIEDLRLIGKTM